jgi:hypothetical protein
LFTNVREQRRIVDARRPKITRELAEAVAACALLRPRANRAFAVPRRFDMKLSGLGLLWVVVATLGVSACSSQPLGAGDEESSASGELVTVTRIGPDASGEPVVLGTRSVARVDVEKAISRRQDALRVANDKTVASVAEPLTLDVHCDVHGLAAGSACSPCANEDIWIYDHANLVGNRMVCLKPFPPELGGTWATHYHLDYVVYDPIEDTRWSWNAQSAWGPENARTNVYCTDDSPVVNLAPNQASNLSCLSSDKVTTWITWQQP